MQISAPLPELTRQIERFDKASCIRELHDVPHLHLDFSDDFLDAMPLEAVRHVLMAAILQARKHAAANRDR